MEISAVMVDERKKGFKFDNRKAEIRPLSSFGKNCELLIKWQYSIYKERWSCRSYLKGLIQMGKENGAVNLGWPELKNIKTRLAFVECSPEIFNSSANFKVFIVCRSIVLLYAGLFIREGNKLYCLHRQEVGIYLPLDERRFWKLFYSVDPNRE